ncbi:glycosyltransferase [Poseidonibacter ostreae]|uniref:Glycosyltransferase n=2 Tax=Poseidonibacter ostreae TaxID=2654171 RepID=A0A6L4WR75_9BACT|nr:glycosyltransferase [Poseidonibacter ostreae]
MKILRLYEAKYPHIQVFQNETNIGGEANFTKCIQNMEGEYAAIYHADDVYMPTIVEEEVKFLINNLDCNSVSTSGYEIDDKSIIIGQRFTPLNLEKYAKFNQIELCTKIQ